MKKSILSIIIMLMTVVGASAKYIIVKGKVGTCQWYITSDSTLVIEPKDGTNSGDLPEEGWGYDYVANNALMANTPWSQYSDKIVYAVVAPGVNAQVTSWMFGSLTKLRAIDISNLNTENVTYMSCMFKDCVSLTTIFLSNFRTNGQTYMSGMFDGCSNLKTIVSHNATPSALKSGTFESFEKRADCTLLVPVGSKALYGEADGWNELGRIEENKDSLKGTWKIGDDKDYMSFVFDNGNVTVQEYSNGVKVGETVYRYFADSEYLTLSTENDLGIRKYEIKGNSLFVWEDGPDGLPTEYIDVSATSSPLIPADAIASGEVGTCIWYVDAEGMLVIAPKDGENGDLPEDGWNDVDGTPWMPYAESITSARFEPGVNATSLDCMFYKLYNLKDVDFTNFDTQNVTKMNRMFSECRGLEYLDLTNLNTENVKSMYRMIHNCFNLKTLNLTNFQTQYAWDLDELLQNCDSLFTIISDNEEPSLLRYNTFNYFGNCSKATLEVPYGSRMEYMQSDGWRSLGFISDGTEPTFPADVLAKGEVNTCLWYITADSTLVIAPSDGVSGDLPEEGWGGTGYNRVYAPWSDYGEMVKAIVVEDGVNAISCRSMFMEMFAAESADLRGLNTENATDLSFMFLKSSNLKTIDISSLKTDNVEYMESMFDGCYQLESIDVSGFNTKNVVSMNGMFSGCESLTTLDLSSFDVSNVTDMNSMFYYCLNLKTLDITNFTASEETATGWLFSNCDSLSTIISKSKTPTALKSGFFESYDNRADCTLLVPTGSKELYAAAEGWNELGKIEEKDFPTDDEDTPGAPLLVKHLELINEYRYEKCFVSEYQYEEPSEYDRSDVFSLASYYDAAPLSPVLDKYKKDSSQKENQVFYLEGGKVYYLDGNTGISKGFTLATDPSDVAKGLRAKVICGIGLNYNVFSSTFQSRGSYSMFMLGHSISDDESEVLHMNKIAFRDIDFDNPEALNYGDNQAGEGAIAANFFINMYSDGVHQIIDSLVIDNCTFKRFVRGFIREQGACHKIWNHVLMSNNLFYDCGYYSSAAGGYPMIAGSGSNNKSNIFKDIKIIENTFYDSPFPSILSLATDDMEWENGAWNITFENNTLVNFNTRAKGVIFSLRCLPDGSVFNVKNNLFVLAKQDGDVRQLGFWGADIRNTMTMEDGTSGTVTLNFSNNWSTNDNLTNGSIFSDSPWSSTSNNFGKLVRDEMAVLNGTLDVKVADISSTDLFTSPCPPHVALTSADQNMHRADALDGSASTKYNVDLYYKNFNNDIVRNNVGASRWNTPHTSVDNYIADIIYQGEINTCKWTIDNQGTLVIAPKNGVSGDLPEYSWSSDYPAPWYEHRDTIKAARIESGVNATYCNSMFYRLSKMETINLSDFETQNVTNMNSMFAGCSALISLDLQNFDTQNVTNMAVMFYDCPSLTSLDVSSFNTQNVTSMNAMFYACSSLTSLDLGKFNTQNVTDMSGMFAGCSSIASLDVSKFNTENVTNMYCMFLYCSSLTTIDLSNFSTQNESLIDLMFANCDSLKYIISNVDEPSSLKVGTFDSFDNRANCTLLVPAGTKELYAEADGWNELGIIKEIRESENPDTIVCFDKFTPVFTYNATGTERITGDTFDSKDKYSLSNWQMQYGYATNDNEQKTLYLVDVIPNPFDIDSVKCIPVVAYQIGDSILIPVQTVHEMTDSDGSTVYVKIFGENGDIKLSITEKGEISFAEPHDFIAYGRFSADSSSDLFENLIGFDKFVSTIRYDNKDSEDIDTTYIAQGEVGSCIWSIDSKGLLTIAPADGIKGELPDWYFNFSREIFNEQIPWYKYPQYITSVKVEEGVYASRCVAMFSDLTRVNDIDISGLNTENATSMTWMFCDCYCLQTLTLTNLNMENVTGEKEMFCGLYNLTTIISNNKTPSTLLPGIFMRDLLSDRDDCTLLVPAGSKALYAEADGWKDFKYIEEMSPDAPEIPADAIASGESGTCIWYITSEGELVIAPADGVSGDLPEDGWTSTNHAPWYEYCESIKSAKVESGVNATTCSQMFNGLSNMESVDLSYFNTEKVTSMNGMFRNCSALISLDLGHFDTQNVTSMNDMFDGCSSLISLDLSNFDTKNVTNMGFMFSRCSSLASLDLSSFDTRNVTDMYEMFYECSSIISLDLSNFDTKNVTRISFMFDGCSSLKSLDLSNVTTENVYEIYDMFSNCDNLSTIISNVSTPSTLKVGFFDSFENRANCTLLVPEGAKELYSAADGWNELGNIEEMVPKFPVDVIASGEVGTCIWYIDASGQLVIAPKNGFMGDLPEEGWESTGSYPYYVTTAPWGGYRDNILSAKVLAGVNAKSCSHMFYGLSKVKEIDLSSFDTKNVKDMSYMFGFCSSLVFLDVSNINTENVTSMYWMFIDCSSLVSLDLSSFDTHNVTSMFSMFDGCYSLSSLDLSNFNTKNVTEDMNWVFFKCSDLTTIISNNVTPSPLKVGTFSGSFDNRANCTLLVPAGTKELYAAADGWNELGKIEEMEDPNRTLFGPLWASVDEEEYIDTHGLELLQLAYPNTLAGTTGYEKYEMGGVNWDAVATLLDSKGTKIEEAYAHEVDSIGAVEFSAKLKRGEEYTVNVPKGLYNIYNIEDFTSIDSPAETLHYTTDYMLGDVDGDENHSVTDVVGVASYLIKGSDEVGKLVIDCNKDDDATVTDITYLVEKVLTGYFPWEALLAKERAPRTVTTPRLFLDSKDNALGLSFDNSSEFCSVQFDIALTDALGNNMTSLGNIRVKAGNGTQGHSITTGIVDGKLRVLVYSLGNKSFKSGDVVTIAVEGSGSYIASITNAELTATCFAAVRPDNVESSFSVADGISELSVSGNAQVYDLTGRKLNASTKQGVVIVNGKKVSGVRIGKIRSK